MMRKMRFWKMRMGALAAVLFLAGNAQAESGKTPVGPKMKFDTTAFDFGTTSLVQSVSGTFIFENAGDRELEITKVAASCGCTTTGIKPAGKKLAPGEKGEISFTLSIGASRGKLKKHITVECNDPQLSSVSLDLAVDVLQVLTVPSQIPIGDLSLGSETNFVIVVKRMDGLPFDLTQVRSTEALISARLDEAGKGEESEKKVLVNVKGSGPARQMIGNLSFFIPGSAVPAASTLVVGKIVGDLRAVPQQVYWGIGNPTNWPGRFPEATTKRVVRLSSLKTDKQFEVLKVTSSLSNVVTSVVTEERGKAYRVTLTLTELPKESQKGEITIETSMPEYPKVIVPVSVFTGQRALDSRLTPRP